MSYYSSKTSGGRGGYGGNNKNGGNNARMAKDDKIMCTVDKKWERSDQFSNNERKKYFDAQLRNKKYAIRCRKHTQAAVPELTCTHCDERKPLEEFSNSMRKADTDDTRRCRLCVDFTETVQHFTEMNFADEATLAGATRDDYKWGEDGGDSGADDESEDGFSTLDDDSTVHASTVHATQRGNLALTTNVLNDYNRMFESDTQSHGASSAPSETGSLTSTESRLHTRQKQKLRHEPENSRGSTSQHTQQNSRLGFNAFGPAGQVQRRAASVVTATETASVKTATTASSNHVPVTRSGWAKVSTRKIAVECPDVFTRGKGDEDVEPKRYDFDQDGSDDEC